jgi:hypothetical protein
VYSASLLHRTLFFLFSEFRRVLNVVFFLLGDSPASEFVCRRFRTLSVPAYTTYEDGTVCSETQAHKIHSPGNHPKERVQQQCFCLVKRKVQKTIFAI